MIHSTAATRGLIELYIRVHNKGERTMRKWVKVSEERYWEMLEILPPAVMTGAGFLVGEPMKHRQCAVTGNTVPVFSAFVEYRYPAGKAAGGGRVPPLSEYFEASEPMSIAEFRLVQPAAIAKEVAA